MTPLQSSSSALQVSCAPASHESDIGSGLPLTSTVPVLSCLTGGGGGVAGTCTVAGAGLVAAAQAVQSSNTIAIDPEKRGASPAQLVNTRIAPVSHDARAPR